MLTVTCQICGQDVDSSLYSHLGTSHQLTARDYLNRYPGAPLVAADLLRHWQASNPVQRTPVTGEEEFCLHGAVIKKRTGCSPLIPPIDQHYQFPPEAAFFIQAVNHRENVLIVGPTGTGKSSLALQVAARVNMPVRRCNLNGETSISDFLGRWTIRGKEMLYREGILTTAMRQGEWLLLDEIDAALPQILFVLQSVLEPSGKLVLLEKDSKVAEPHPEFRIAATANTLGNGDETGLYSGTQVLNEAFKDRFATVIHLDYPDETAEIAILQAKAPGLKKSVLARMVKCALQVREAAAREECCATFSTRRLIALASKYGQLGNLAQALELTVLNKLSTDDRRVILEIAQRRLGDLLNPHASSPNSQAKGDTPS